MEDADLTKIKAFYSDAAPEVKQQIKTLENSIKTNRMYVVLAENDAVKMILAYCESQIAQFNKLLIEQPMSELSTPPGLCKRAEWLARRDEKMWFQSIFSRSQANLEAIDRRVADIGQKIADE